MANSTAARPKYFWRKTVVVVSGCLMIFLLCNYVVLISQLSTTSGSSYDNSPEISTTSTWKEILRNNTSSSSRIGIHVLHHPGSKMPLTNIVVLGERHSGTTFFTKYLSDCFPKANVRDTFVNNKHWMQFDPDYLLDVVASDHASSAPSLWQDIVKDKDNGILDKYAPSKQSSNKYFRNSFVVILFRNPYDW